MNPTRRQFITGSAAAIGGAALFVQLPIDALASPAMPAVVVDRRGLPPSRREMEIRCGNCGTAMGHATIDELDRPGADFVCWNCFDKVKTERDELAHDDGLGERSGADDEDFEGQLETLQGEMDDLQRRHKQLLRRIASIDSPVRDMQDLARSGDTKRLERKLEHTRELVDDLVKAYTP